MPRSAYQLYFRFCRNIIQYPSLQRDLVKLDKSNKEQYKLYVQSVLDANLDALPFDENAAHQKFMGSTSFSGMSKMIGQKWKSADSLTHVTFKELAKKNRDRYKKKLFDSYLSFTKNLPVPNAPAKDTSDGVLQQQEAYIKVPAPSGADKVHSVIQSGDKRMDSVTPSNDRASEYTITEVDMSDEEIIAIAMTVWGVSPTELFSEHNDNNMPVDRELREFLFSIEWD